MTAQLTDIEKLNLIDNHIKNCMSNRYNLQLSLVAENAVAEPSQELIASITEKIAREDARQAALEAEAATLNPGV